MMSDSNKNSAKRIIDDYRIAEIKLETLTVFNAWLFLNIAYPKLFIATAFLLTQKYSKANIQEKEPPEIAPVTPSIEHIVQVMILGITVPIATDWTL